MTVGMYLLDEEGLHVLEEDCRPAKSKKGDCRKMNERGEIRRL